MVTPFHPVQGVFPQGGGAKCVGRQAARPAGRLRRTGAPGSGRGQRPLRDVREAQCDSVMVSARRTRGRTAQ